MTIDIVRDPTTRARLAALAQAQFCEFVKRVVDIHRDVMAIGGELQSDAEAILLADGSRRGDPRGINLYLIESGEGWIEFDAAGNTVQARTPYHATESKNDQHEGDEEDDPRAEPSAPGAHPPARDLPQTAPGEGERRALTRIPE